MGQWTGQETRRSASVVVPSLAWVVCAALAVPCAARAQEPLRSGRDIVSEAFSEQPWPSPPRAEWTERLARPGSRMVGAARPRPAGSWPSPLVTSPVAEPFRAADSQPRADRAPLPLAAIVSPRFAAQSAAKDKQGAAKDKQGAAKGKQGAARGDTDHGGRGAEETALPAAAAPLRGLPARDDQRSLALPSLPPPREASTSDADEIDAQLRRRLLMPPGFARPARPLGKTFSSERVFPMPGESARGLALAQPGARNPDRGAPDRGAEGPGDFTFPPPKKDNSLATSLRKHPGSALRAPGRQDDDARSVLEPAVTAAPAAPPSKSLAQEPPAADTPLLQRVLSRDSAQSLLYLRVARRIAERPRKQRESARIPLALPDLQDISWPFVVARARTAGRPVPPRVRAELAPASPLRDRMLAPATATNQGAVPSPASAQQQRSSLVTALNRAQPVSRDSASAAQARKRNEQRAVTEGGTEAPARRADARPGAAQAPAAERARELLRRQSGAQPEDRQLRWEEASAPISLARGRARARRGRAEPKAQGARGPDLLPPAVPEQGKNRAGERETQAESGKSGTRPATPSAETPRTRKPKAQGDAMAKTPPRPQPPPTSVHAKLESSQSERDAAFQRAMADWDKDLTRASQASATVRFTDAKGSKFEGTETADGVFLGLVHYPDGGVFEGEVRDGQRWGIGIMRYPGGGVYRGTWERDHWHGEGLSLAANGNRYQGSYVSGKKQGVGRYEWVDGSVYEGEFHGGRQHGLGVQISGDGDRYEGMWHRGARHGQGTMLYRDGDHYEGSWRAGKRHGEGVYLWHTGARYAGQWVEGNRHGEGVMTTEDGQIYDGGWRFDYRHGKGSLTLPSGVVESGMWFYGRASTYAVAGEDGSPLRRGAGAPAR